MRVANEEGFRNPQMERLEKAQKAIETRKQYSGIVKEIFFKDALIASKNSKSHQNFKLSDIGSLRSIKEAADQVRKKEF